MDKGRAISAPLDLQQVRFKTLFLSSRTVLRSVFRRVVAHYLVLDFPLVVKYKNEFKTLPRMDLCLCRSFLNFAIDFITLAINQGI